jgi:hypothetical protein
MQCVKKKYFFTLSECVVDMCRFYVKFETLKIKSKVFRVLGFQDHLLCQASGLCILDLVGVLDSFDHARNI